MRRLLEFKAIVLILALAGLVGLGLLAAALREANFQPPGPFPFSFTQGEGLGSMPSRFDLPFLDVIIFAALVLLLVGVVIALLDPRTRKRAVIALLRFALTMLVLWWVMEKVAVRFPEETETLGNPASAPGNLASFAEPSPEFVPPQVNSWVVFAVSFAVALGLVMLAWFVVSHRSKSRRSATFDEVAVIARRALEGLQDGQDWDDAIILAYIRMNEAVTAERGLIRQPNVTPSEFAVRMEQMGLPGEAARTLTRLFEQVRYGGQTSTYQERDLAAAALNAILRACGVSPSGVPLAREAVKTRQG